MTYKWASKAFIPCVLKRFCGKIIFNRKVHFQLNSNLMWNLRYQNKSKLAVSFLDHRHQFQAPLHSQGKGSVWWLLTFLLNKKETVNTWLSWFGKRLILSCIHYDHYFFCKNWWVGILKWIRHSQFETCHRDKLHIRSKNHFKFKYMSWPRTTFIYNFLSISSVIQPFCHY